MSAGWEMLVGSGGALAVRTVPGNAAQDLPASAVVLCHGFPLGLDSSAHLGVNLSTLADRLAADAGWRVVVGCLRGVGQSAGDFSLGGWLDDLKTLVDHAAELARGGGVWIVGFGTGGALGLCVAAEDRRVRGAACLGAPATFADWAHDLPGVVGHARRVGVIHGPAFPGDVRAWGEAFVTLRPTEAAARIAPRPILIVHGADDEEVPVTDGRALAEAAGAGAELRVLAGAGHRLRADPRAVALLVGWLERQRR